MPVEPPRESSDAIAIVGIGGRFAAAPAADRLWANILAGVDATGEVPPGRWLADPSEVYDPRMAREDHVYSTRGGFLTGPPLDPEGIGREHELPERLDPVFRLALDVAEQAWRDARTEAVDRGRAGVIFGHIVLPTETASALARLVLKRRWGEQLGVPAAEPDEFEPGNAFPAGLPAAVIARALGLRGVAYTLDAACSSSLYALKLAIDELRSGRADVMLSGGVSRPDPLYTQMGFSQLRALSARGRSAPLDHRGDGLVVGEGAGMFVLKRLAEALGHGDRVYGIIAGIGLSNDVHGDLLAPDVEGQLRAMQAAYGQAGWRPDDVDLIECHATGTPRGDAVEVESLKALWGRSGWRPGQCIIGSVKGNVGHALTAAGSAGLLKVLLALNHRVLPATANFERPAPGLGLEASPFRVLTRAEPWPARIPGQPRRAAVSGFGFGGINAHVLIEEWCGTTQEGRSHPAGGERSSTHAVPRAPHAASIAIVGISTQIGPMPGQQAFRDLVFDGKRPGPASGPRERSSADEAAESQRAGWNSRSIPGHRLDAIEFRVGEFRIPPRELEEMLPQQSLMLGIAAEAIRDAGWDPRHGPRTGVLIGIGLDLETTRFHLRWWLPQQARAWSQALGTELSAAELSRWIEELRESAGPPLTANRTMGSLGGLVASRIAREYRIGGPSFTVSCDETSGLQALAIAIEWLRRGELDAAVVGAIDRASDIHAVIARERLGPVRSDPTTDHCLERDPNPRASDGAVCLVLKRLEDAQRDHDRVYAVIRGFGSATAGKPEHSSVDLDPRATAARRAMAQAGVAASAIGLLEFQIPDSRFPIPDPGSPIPGAGSPVPGPEFRTPDSEFGIPDSGLPISDARFPICDARSPLPDRIPPTSVSGIPNPESGIPVGSLQAEIGTTGAAAGLASVVKAALCLHHAILPPARGEGLWRRDAGGLAATGWVPAAAQFWLRNRMQGPRRAGVSGFSLGGNGYHVILEEAPSSEVGPAPEMSAAQPERGEPVVARRLGLFALEAGDEAGLADRIRDLGELARESPAEPIDSLAGRWWRSHPNDPRLHCGLAIIADGTESLRSMLERAGARAGPRGKDRSLHARGSIHAARDDGSGLPRRLALVYPGLGECFEGMGRELALLWPEVLRAQDAENRSLRDQLQPAVWWNGSLPRKFVDPRIPILGQVTLGSLVTDGLMRWGIQPEAAIGYSLGESSGLVASRAWTDRDELLDRLRASPLFESELAGPCHAARRAWAVPASEPVEWVAGIVSCPAEEVHTAIVGRTQVYVLIRNTPEETVIGGSRRSVTEVARALRCSFVELPTVSTVHCPIGRALEPEYRALHDLETRAPAGITFYSGVWGRPYAVDRRSAAQAITAQAAHPIDFPAVIERAYEDGIGVFIEVGPGSSCTRLIDRILGSRAHVACSACRPDRDALAAVLEVLGECVAHRLPVDLGALYRREAIPPLRSAASSDARFPPIRVAVGGRPSRVPPLPFPFPSGAKPGGAPPSASRPQASTIPTMTEDKDPAPTLPVPSSPAMDPIARASSTVPPLVRCRDASGRDGGFGELPRTAGLWPSLAGPLHDAERARSEAHRAFLRVAQGTTELWGQHLAFQLELIEGWEEAGPSSSPRRTPGPDPGPAIAPSDRERGPSGEATLFDRSQCLEFAVGSIGPLLGPDFAEVDRLPTRVRLPDEPLMLVDRILALEGTPRSLQAGRVVTEHVIEPGAWYLDPDRVAPCIAMEAGQADLVLCGYLGVDFVTRGRAVYRLLDATVTFHRGLPTPGAVMRYDIRISSFFRQGTTILFRFEFDATVAGEPLLTMRDGCAGFFTPEELAAGKGIAPRGQDDRSRPARADELIPLSPTRLDEHQVEALRRGDLTAAFGSPFDRLAPEDWVAVPGGRMTLIHRVAALDPVGGSSGLGSIRAEADIEPAAWFMVCHFVDDRVMPGTLMYESCLHTLRVLLIRLGWIGLRGRAAFEPVPGIANRLKCRGQITESTRVATYEVNIKERGYRPEPYAIADALIFADGKPIVEVTDLALQLAGTSRPELERLWKCIQK